jgi:hypothetical protein
MRIINLIFNMFYSFFFQTRNSNTILLNHSLIFFLFIIFIKEKILFEKKAKYSKYAY